MFQNKPSAFKMPPASHLNNVVKVVYTCLGLPKPGSKLNFWYIKRTQIFGGPRLTWERP